AGPAIQCFCGPIGTGNIQPAKTIEYLVSTGALAENYKVKTFVGGTCGETIRPGRSWVSDESTVIGINNAITVNVCPFKITRFCIGLYHCTIFVHIIVDIGLGLKNTER